MKPPRRVDNELILGLVSVSDRASQGVYEDKGIPALEAWCQKAIKNPLRIHKRLIADERFEIEKTLRELVDIIGCDLILTTGGTGPSRRDVTPEATLAVATREMPGFGEQMRAISMHFVPTAILSRQVGVLRETPDHAALILNLPGQPKAIAETLEGFKDENGKPVAYGIFEAVPYCIDLIGGPYIETHEEVVTAFRPKSARKPVAESAPAETAPQAEKVAAPVEPTVAPTPAAPVATEVPSPAPAPEEAPSVREPVAESAPAPTPTPEPAPTPEAKPAAMPSPVNCPFKGKDLLIPTTQASIKPDYVVVWMHGMGSENREYENFGREFSHFGGPNCQFILPNAPLRELSQHPGIPIRAWYDFDGTQREDVEGIQESAQRINMLLDFLTQSGIPRDRIILGGFSQGAAITLYAGLRQKEPLAALVALSGYLPMPNTLYSEVTEAALKTPVFIGHGEFDPIVPYVWARQSAKIIGETHPNLLFKSYPMEHSICSEELQDLMIFLNRLSGFNSPN